MKKIALLFLLLIMLLVGGALVYNTYIKSKDTLGINRINGKDANFKKPDLMGEITNISNNVVTIKLLNIDRPGNKPQVQKSDASNEQVAIPTFSMQYTGETKDITIPEGKKISNNRRGQSDLTIADLKVGDVISITYKDDKTTIDSIRLFRSRLAEKSNTQ